MQIILASQSPRRKELLGQMGISDFIIRHSHINIEVAVLALILFD